MLNFGHTVGHAIESAQGYALRHGECVALGMVAAARISVALGLLDKAGEALIVDTLQAFGLPVKLSPGPSVKQLSAYLACDKKAATGRARYVLLEGLGQAVLHDDVPEEIVDEVLRTLIA